ncbi:Alkaline phosphatase synthesis transcriptional regulatory protein PhoP [Thermoflexales bacterium]|nr:Alkaline phosphatase synthesis transcriptional regulatory protein PhoP [Thermoflexales bacterium]
MSKLIIIDDDVSVRSNLVELFEMEGFEVIGAENGRVGVQLARQHLPDLIVCDIMMPDLDGYGVLEELRQDFVTATIPFIFLTAKADKADVRQGMSLGADDYLVKPFTRDEILAAVSTRLTKQAVLTQKMQVKLDDLRANIALALPHELRLPLTGILGSSELLLEEAASLPLHDIQDLARNINLAGKRLQALIMNFLLYADLAMALRDPYFAVAVKDPSPCRMESVVTEVAGEQARLAHREADLQLEVEPASVSLGSVYLAKLIRETVNNAFKFSRPGRPVRIMGRQEAPHYRLTLEDHGRGMTPEQIGNIGAYLQFERRRHEQQGQGLGLIIAKWIAELHGGKLTIDSVYGESSTVHVVLPLCLDEPSGSDEFYAKVWHD